MEKIRFYLTSKNIILALTILLVLSLGGSIYFYQKANVDPQRVAKRELDYAIAAIGRIMVLPTNETPTLAIVSDPEKLRSQPFFANARKGDKVLVYTLARKAILYDPSQNKIVDVAPLNLDSSHP